MAVAAAAHRNTAFSHIADGLRANLRKVTIVLGIASAIECVVLFLNGNPAAAAFLLISSTSLAGLIVWQKHGQGLPLLALIVAENLTIYGLPIVVGNEGVFRYPADLLTSAGWEVAVFNLALILGWRLAMVLVRPASPLCYALLGFDSASPKLTQLGLSLLITGSSYEILNSLNLLDSVIGLLPAGATSIVRALTAAISACGFFLCGMMMGRGQMTRMQSIVFWVLLAAQCFITAASLLLSASIIIVFASIIGLFWGSGRIPWRYITLTVAIVAFLNLGKFTMRDKYWDMESGTTTVGHTLGEMPQLYTEWSQASIDVLTGNAKHAQARQSFTGFSSSDEKTDNGQSLLTRINNLENLLFVIDAVERTHIAPLGGATYSLIPPLLVPRMLWPDKPRTHEGQVLLNVYFGRQDLTSTFKTYIAWGLLPEAYGNFGPIAGAIILGVALGMFCAWIERYVSQKLVLSLEGFLSFTLFLGMASSYEMVASVLVTSLFQAFVPITLACAPFVARIQPKRRAAAPAPAETESDPQP